MFRCHAGYRARKARARPAIRLALSADPDDASVIDRAAAAGFFHA
jgi:hypothetical protein